MLRIIYHLIVTSKESNCIIVKQIETHAATTLKSPRNIPLHVTQSILIREAASHCPNLCAKSAKEIVTFFSTEIIDALSGVLSATPPVEVGAMTPR